MSPQRLSQTVNRRGIITRLPTSVYSYQTIESSNNILPGPIGPELFVFAAIIAISLTTWVYFDARKHQRNTILWTLAVGSSFFVLFIGGIIAVMFYLLYINKIEKVE